MLVLSQKQPFLAKTPLQKAHLLAVKAYGNFTIVTKKYNERAKRIELYCGPGMGGAWDVVGGVVILAAKSSKKCPLQKIPK